MFGEHHLFEPHEWLVKFRNPFGEFGQIWWEPSFFTNEMEFYLLAILTYIHASRHGSRYLWLWWTTVAHGLMTELVSYWAEPIDNFWHAQSTFMFFGQREPLHIMCLYPGYIYTASIAVERLHLSEICQSCAVALFVLLFDLPYDVVGVKLLWWTWHDTDANIRDRHYWVPWTSYYFHLTFAFAFNFIYHRARRNFVGITPIYSTDKLESRSFADRFILSKNTRGEFKALLLTGICSMPFGICQFVPGYHFFKDIFGVNGQVTTGILGAIYLCVVIYGLQHRNSTYIKCEGEVEVHRGVKNRGKGKWYYDEIMMCVLIHYTHYIMLVTFTNPEKKQALGLHQPMGSAPGSGDEFDCSAMRNLSYPYPFTPAAFPAFLQADLWDVTVWKRPYLCGGGYLLDEAYFNFNCPMAKQQEWTPGNMWFWICGTSWTDGSGLSHVEYALVVYALCFLGLMFYTDALCYPRNFYQQFIVLGEFPKYYLTDKPEKEKRLKSIEQKRWNDETKAFEYLVSYEDIDKCHTDEGSQPVRNLEDWVAEDSLHQDGVGEMYGERDGMYGRLYDTYRSGSSRDRLHAFDALKNATERLERYKKTEEYIGKNDLTEASSTIDYTAGVPKPKFDLDDLRGVTKGELLSKSAAPTENMSTSLPRENDLRKRK